MRTLTLQGVKKKKGRNVFVETFEDGRFPVSAAVGRPVFKYNIWSHQFLTHRYSQISKHMNWLMSEPLHPCPPLMWNSIKAHAVHQVIEDFLLGFFAHPLENTPHYVVFFPSFPGSQSPSPVRPHDTRGGAVMVVARRICTVWHKMPAQLLSKTQRREKQTVAMPSPQFVTLVK